MEIVIQPAQVSDAATLKTLGEIMLGETPFFHRLPEERASSVDEMAHVIGSIQATPNSVLLTAWIDDTAVGEAILSGGQLSRISHTATLGLGVLKAYWGRGVGQALLKALEEAARRFAHTRLELTVLSENTRAIALYQRFGFRVEGQKIGSVMIDGVLKDELLMAKLL